MTPVRLEPADPRSLESSTLPLSHCAPNPGQLLQNVASDQSPLFAYRMFD